MTRRYSIPFVVDLLIVENPVEIAFLDAQAPVTRNFRTSKSFAVRWLGARFRRVLSIGNTPFPALLPRDDRIREGQTAALQQRFGPRGEGAVILPEDIEALARYVRGDSGEPAMMARLQGIVGRQFVPDYQASAQTLHDAFLLDTAARSVLKGLWFRLTGQTRQAKRRLALVCDGDLYAAHGTVIALHSLAVPMRTLRRRFADSGACRRSPAEVVAEAIEPPPKALRSVSGRVEAPFLTRPLGAKSLLIFDPPQNVGAAESFAMGRWSQCPAHGFVWRLLEEVWRAAAEAKAETCVAA
jgi:hypothetical protein